MWLAMMRMLVLVRPRCGFSRTHAINLADKGSVFFRKWQIKNAERRRKVMLVIYWNFFENLNLTLLTKMKKCSSMLFSLTINFNNSEKDGHHNTSFNKHKTKFNLSLNTTHWTLFGFRTTLFVEYLRCKFPMLSLNNKIHTQNRSLIGHQIPHIYYKLCFFLLYA